MSRNVRALERRKKQRSVRNRTTGGGPEWTSDHGVAEREVEKMGVRGGIQSIDTGDITW